MPRKSLLKSKRDRNSGGQRAAGRSLSRKDEAVQWFQREDFSPADFINTHLQQRTEKELEQARHELTALNEYCKQEVQAVVHAHHGSFLAASRDLPAVEGLVSELRSYVAGGAALVADLAAGQGFGAAVAAAGGGGLAAEAAAAAERERGKKGRSRKRDGEELPVEGDAGSGPQLDPSAWEGILAVQAELLQDLQVAVQERDFATARCLLAAGRDLIAVVERDAALLEPQAGGEGSLSGWRYGLEGRLVGAKAALVAELNRRLGTPGSSTYERRAAAQILTQLVGPSQAAQALLRCHTLRVRAAQQQLLKHHSTAGGDPDGVEYAGSLAQRTFLAIATAVDDVRAVFPASAGPTSTSASSSSTPAGGALDSSGGPLPSVSALLVAWAGEEAAECSALLCDHSLRPFAATGGAVDALIAVGLALVFCAALEASHGLALKGVFLGSMWGLAEAIVRRHLRRLRDVASSATALDATNAVLYAMGRANPAAAAAGPQQQQQPGGGGGSSVSGPAAGVSSGADGPSALPPLPELPKLPELPGAASAGAPGSQALSFLVPGGAGGPAALAAAAAASPAGLTALPVLLPELRALADGLRPLGSVPAAAVLRQGAIEAFAAVCEAAHGSLSRLMASYGGGNSASSSSGTGAAGGVGGAAAGAAGAVPGGVEKVGGGKGAGAAAGGQRPLLRQLAGYAAALRGALQEYAELDMQEALAPLAALCGPVAPPELLLPLLAPLDDLIASLPPPPPPPPPASTTTSTHALQPQRSSKLLRQHSSGLLDLIRAEVEEAEGGERGGEEAGEGRGSGRRRGGRERQGRGLGAGLEELGLGSSEVVGEEGLARMQVEGRRVAEEEGEGRRGVGGRQGRGGEELRLGAPLASVAEGSEEVEHGPGRSVRREGKRRDEGRVDGLNTGGEWRGEEAGRRRTGLEALMVPEAAAGIRASREPARSVRRRTVTFEDTGDADAGDALLPGLPAAAAAAASVEDAAVQRGRSGRQEQRLDAAAEETRPLVGRGGGEEVEGRGRRRPPVEGQGIVQHAEFEGARAGAVARDVVSPGSATGDGAQELRRPRRRTVEQPQGEEEGAGATWQGGEAGALRRRPRQEQQQQREQAWEEARGTEQPGLGLGSGRPRRAERQERQAEEYAAVPEAAIGERGSAESEVRQRRREERRQQQEQEPATSTKSASAAAGVGDPELEAAEARGRRREERQREKERERQQAAEALEEPPAADLAPSDGGRSARGQRGDRDRQQETAPDDPWRLAAAHAIPYNGLEQPVRSPGARAGAGGTRARERTADREEQQDGEQQPEQGGMATAADRPRSRRPRSAAGAAGGEREDSVEAGRSAAAAAAAVGSTTLGAARRRRPPVGLVDQVGDAGRVVPSPGEEPGFVPLPGPGRRGRERSTSPREADAEVESVPMAGGRASRLRTGLGDEDGTGAASPQDGRGGGAGGVAATGARRPGRFAVPLDSDDEDRPARTHRLRRPPAAGDAEGAGGSSGAATGASAGRAPSAPRGALARAEAGGGRAESPPAVRQGSRSAGRLGRPPRATETEAEAEGAGVPLARGAARAGRDAGGAGAMAAGAAAVGAAAAEAAGAGVAAESARPTSTRRYRSALQDSDDDTGGGRAGPAAPRHSRFPRPAAPEPEPTARSAAPAPASRTRAVEEPSPGTSADAAPTRLRRPNRFSAPESPNAAGAPRAEVGPLGAGAEQRENMTAKERIAARMAARAAAGAEAGAGAAGGGGDCAGAGAGEAGGRGASVGRTRLVGRARASVQDPEDDLL